ncbi:MAG: DUF308 domain-containing protein [Pseudonocardiaceae bacterium]
MTSQLTIPHPDEPERDGPASQGSFNDLGSSKDTDTAFAHIVAGLRAAEPNVHPSPAGEADDDQFEPSGQRPTASEADEDRFEPPEPPPLPVPRPRTLGGVLVLTVGMLLLAQPALLGLAEQVATPLGLLALTAGIGWLGIGLRSGPPSEGSDDGARL